jgi:hypothetical protein
LSRFKRLKLFVRAIRNVSSRKYIDPAVKERIGSNAIKLIGFFLPSGILNILINPFIIHKSEAITCLSLGFLLLFASYMIAERATVYLALMISALLLSLSEMVIVIFTWYFFPRLIYSNKNQWMGTIFCAYFGSSCTLLPL